MTALDTRLGYVDGRPMIGPFSLLLRISVFVGLHVATLLAVLALL